MKTENHAQDHARAKYESIVAMLAAVDCDYDRLEELRDSEPDTQEEELAALFEAASDCTSQDEALERITENALEVSVRGGWHNPGEVSESEEFYILLCTGGPAVRIRGELDRMSPRRAWIEYQDWGTPWTQWLDADQDVLIRYCDYFYFGE